jgi:hypothetical protein
MSATEREERRAKRKEARLERQKARKERRASRKQARIARREERRGNKNTLADRIGEKIERVFDNELQLIRQEKSKNTLVPVTPTNWNSFLTNIALESISLLPVPGFLGFIQIVPELLASLKAQIRLVYNTALTKGIEEEKITKELLLLVFLEAHGEQLQLAGKIENGKLYVYQHTEAMRKEVVKALTNTIFKQLLRSAACKWIPVVGKMVLDVWTQRAVSKLLHSAEKILQQNIEMITPPVIKPILGEAISVTEMPEEHEDADLLKLLAMVSIMKMDKQLTPEEIQLLNTMIADSDLDEDEKEEIFDALETEDEIPIDFSFYKERTDEAIALLLDIIAFAKADKKIEYAELAYLLSLSEQLNIKKEEIMLMIAQNTTIC